MAQGFEPVREELTYREWKFPLTISTPGKGVSSQFVVAAYIISENSFIDPAKIDLNELRFPGGKSVIDVLIGQ
jgi:hypothetical protein